MKTNEETAALIAEARRWANGHPNRRAGELMRDLADALEAATEGDYHEGLEEGIKIGMAERDAALVAVERVGAILAVPWREGGIPEHWHRQLVAALDGAPEPEWEYGFHFLDDDGNIYKTRGGWDTPEKAQALGDEWIVDERESHMLNDQPDIHVALVRRRKAGPWLPVEGEKP